MSYSIPCVDLTGHDFFVEIGPGLNRGGSKLKVAAVKTLRAAGAPGSEETLAFELRLAVSEDKWVRSAVDLVASVRIGTQDPASKHGVLQGSFGRWELRPGKGAGLPLFITPWPALTIVEFAEIDLHENLPGD
ncbi:hypothetical protein ITJ42_15775 [Clavibacter michiganensis subsp. phaseoli]|uniref:Uncharacterized protein n=1 Tax=Clavibacter phaseoli TaxID=1734031 RepID=A0A8I0SBQ0_9MICO|nr:hypothetical protein [Clavibacter phaseoli]MBF4632678.1 hypothetical protein [Clavibacter phaseoli]